MDVGTLVESQGRRGNLNTTSFQYFETLHNAVCAEGTDDEAARRELEAYCDTQYERYPVRKCWLAGRCLHVLLGSEVAAEREPARLLRAEW